MSNTNRLPAQGDLGSPGNLLGDRIFINPQTLQSASVRMNRRLDDRFGAKEREIRTALRQIRAIRSDQTNREDRLANRMFTMVNQSGLNNLFSSFESSYRQVSQNLPRFRRVSESVLPADLTATFAARHGVSNANTNWFVDGSSWSNSSFSSVHQTTTRAVLSVMNSIKSQNMTLDDVFKETSRGRNRHPIRTSLPVEAAYISRINKIASESPRVLRGVGHRDNERDAIVRAMRQAFEVLEINLETALNKGKAVANRANIIASRVTNLDTAAARELRTGKNVNMASVPSNTIRGITVRPPRRAALLSDGRGLVRARENQVDSRCRSLHNDIQVRMHEVSDYISRTNNNEFITRCETAVREIDAWFRSLDRRISSQGTETVVRETSHALTSTGHTSVTSSRQHTVGGRQQRLQLSEYISSDLRADMNEARRTIQGWIQSFRTTSSRALTFSDTIVSRKSSFRTLVENVIYPGSEFSQNIRVARGVAQMLRAAASEFEQLGRDILIQQSGRTITAYAGELGQTATYFKDIARTIDEDFGLNASRGEWNFFSGGSSRSSGDPNFQHTVGNGTTSSIAGRSIGGSAYVARFNYDLDGIDVDVQMGHGRANAGVSNRDGNVRVNVGASAYAVRAQMTGRINGGPISVQTTATGSVGIGVSGHFTAGRDGVSVGGSASAGLGSGLVITIIPNREFIDELRESRHQWGQTINADEHATLRLNAKDWAWIERNFPHWQLNPELSTSILYQLRREYLEWHAMQTR